MAIFNLRTMSREERERRRLENEYRKALLQSYQDAQAIQKRQNNMAESQQAVGSILSGMSSQEQLEVMQDPAMQAWLNRPDADPNITRGLDYAVKSRLPAPPDLKPVAAGSSIYDFSGEEPRLVTTAPKDKEKDDWELKTFGNSTYWASPSRQLLKKADIPETPTESDLSEMQNYWTPKEGGGYETVLGAYNPSINRLQLYDGEKGWRIAPPGTVQATVGSTKEDRPPKAPTSTEAGRVALLNTGRAAVESLRNFVYTDDGNVDYVNIVNMSTPLGGTPGTEGRTARVAATEAVEAKIRLETGAAAPDKEVTRTVRRVIPSPLDHPDTIAFKLDLISEFLEGALLVMEGGEPDWEETHKRIDQRLEQAPKRPQRNPDDMTDEEISALPRIKQGSDEYKELPEGSVFVDPEDGDIYRK